MSKDNNATKPTPPVITPKAVNDAKEAEELAAAEAEKLANEPDPETGAANEPPFEGYDKIPCNWEVKENPDNPKLLIAKNSLTSRIFTGSRTEFKKLFN